MEGHLTVGPCSETETVDIVSPDLVFNSLLEDDLPKTVGFAEAKAVYLLFVYPINSVL